MSHTIDHKLDASLITKPIMMNIPASKAFTYPILVASDLLAHPEKWLPTDWQKKRLVIITDDNVNKIYGKHLSTILEQAKPLLLSFMPGEKSKNSQIKLNLEQRMIQAHCDRDTLILALGGGVVGDIAGFIAATYMRGISYIQIPTTLLAMVDSSVGGKTGINVPQGKNLIGAFWQPTCVIADMNCLSTLPQVHLINGLIEAIKMFATSDAKLFNYVNTNINDILDRNTLSLKKVIEHAIKIKVNIVSSDEKENHQRMILNFGHTIGHALEKMTDYTLLHGNAVALGMLVEAKISELLGYLSPENYQIIQSLMSKLNISGHQLRVMDFDKIIQATYTDKKMKECQVRYILLNKIGEVRNDNHTVAHPVPDEIILKSLHFVKDGSNGG